MRVVYTPEAEKQFAKLDKPTQKRIKNTVFCVRLKTRNL